MNPAPLSRLLVLCPKTNAYATQQLRQAFQTISDAEFRSAKDRICLLKELFPLLKRKHLGFEQTSARMLVATLEGEMGRARVDAKANSAGSASSGKWNYTRPTLNPTFWAAGIRLAWKALSLGESEVEADMLNELVPRAEQAAVQITDSHFLSQLEKDVERYTQYNAALKPLADRARQKAFEYLKVGVTQMVRKLTPAVHKMQVEECLERIKHNCVEKTEEEQSKLRLSLIRRLNSLSAQTPYT